MMVGLYERGAPVGKWEMDLDLDWVDLGRMGLV